SRWPKKRGARMPARALHATAAPACKPTRRTAILPPAARGPKTAHKSAASGGHMDRLLSAGYRRWLLTVLVIISAYGFVDRSVMTALAEAVKQDLKLNDQQVGMLQGLGFAITYLLFGIPFARFSERFSRVWVTAIAITIWSVLTIGCGFVTNYWQLLI